MFTSGELLTLADKLEGPLNIEHAILPIEIKLSDAILNFHENINTISAKVSWVFTLLFVKIF